jgi:hypothetical protein
MLWRIGTYLEVEGASLRGVLELGVLVTLLEQSVELDDDIFSSALFYALHKKNGVVRPASPRGARRWWGSWRGSCCRRWPL